MPVEIKNSKGQTIFIYQGEILARADLKNTNLEDAVLAGMNCSEAIFDGANLRFAHCRGANFSGASFRNVDMLKAQMYSTNCQGADFEGVDMERARFDNADLTGAKNWHNRERDYQAKFLGATMPDGRKVEEE